MKLYPVYLKLNAVACLVVGGGVVARRKVQALLRSGANVTVVSPRICAGLRVLLAGKKICYEESAYNNKFLRGVFLVIAATDRPEVNARIAQDAGQRGMLVNVADEPELCNFYVPAVACHNGIMVAISTQGAFPGLAKKLRQKFQPVVNAYAKYARAMALLRSKIKRDISDQRTRKKMIKCLLDPRVQRLIEAGKVRTPADLLTMPRVMR